MFFFNQIFNSSGRFICFPRKAVSLKQACSHPRDSLFGQEPRPSFRGKETVSRGPRNSWQFALESVKLVFDFMFRYALVAEEFSDEIPNLIRIVLHAEPVEGAEFGASLNGMPMSSSRDPSLGRSFRKFLDGHIVNPSHPVDEFARGWLEIIFDTA